MAKSQWQNSHPDQESSITLVYGMVYGMNITKLIHYITGQQQLPTCWALFELTLYASVLIKHLTYAGRISINVKLIHLRATFETMLTLSVVICAGYLMELQSMHPYVTGIKKQLHNLMQTPPTDDNPWHR